MKRTPAEQLQKNLNTLRRLKVKEKDVEDLYHVILILLDHRTIRPSEIPVQEFYKIKTNRLRILIKNYSEVLHKILKVKVQYNSSGIVKGSDHGDSHRGEKHTRMSFPATVSWKK